MTTWSKEVPSPRQQLHINTDALRRDTGFTEVSDPEDGFNEMVRFAAYERLGTGYRKFY